ncbi:hypothetical protein GCM10010524_11440 [Streptomyces mexicanus]
MGDVSPGVGVVPPGRVGVSGGRDGGADGVVSGVDGPGGVPGGGLGGGEGGGSGGEGGPGEGGADPTGTSAAEEPWISGAVVAFAGPAHTARAAVTAETPVRRAARRRVVLAIIDPGGGLRTCGAGPRRCTNSEVALNEPVEAVNEPLALAPGPTSTLTQGAAPRNSAVGSGGCRFPHQVAVGSPGEPSPCASVNLPKAPRSWRARP